MLCSVKTCENHVKDNYKGTKPLCDYHKGFKAGLKHGAAGTANSGKASAGGTANSGKARVKLYACELDSHVVFVMGVTPQSAKKKLYHAIRQGTALEVHYDESTVSRILEKAQTAILAEISGGVVHIVSEDETYIYSNEGREYSWTAPEEK